MIVLLKMAWFLWIALFPCWVGIICGIYMMIKERIKK